MKNFYIKDKTINQTVYFSTVNEVVNYLGKSLVPRAFKMNINQYKQHLTDLGHGYDDNGVVLTRSVSESFDIGIVRDGRHIRTDIHESVAFKDSSFGD